MSAVLAIRAPQSTSDPNASWDGSLPSVDGNDAGAAGNSSANSITISTGALVAIVIVVVVVILIGVSTATLFFIAKKREWTIRETIRRSTKKVATALTPRRSEFPRSVKGSTRSSRKGRSRLADDVPPTPRVRTDDLEKGLSQIEVKTKRGEQGRQ